MSHHGAIEAPCISLLYVCAFRNQKRSHNQRWEHAKTPLRQRCVTDDERLDALRWRAGDS